MASTAETVANAKCFVCLTHRQHLAIQTYLLAILAGTTTSPATLMQLAGCVFCVPQGRLLALQAYLLAVAKGTSTDPSTLMVDSACSCVPPGIDDAVRTYGLAVESEQSQDPEVLMPLAKCFMCYTPKQTAYIQTYLMGVWAGVDVSTTAGIADALELSVGFTGLPPSALEHIQSYLDAFFFITPVDGDTVILDDGTGTFWLIIADVSGIIGAQTDAGPATADVILDDGGGGFWKVIVDTSGVLGTESNAGPATVAPEISDGTQLWRLVVDVIGNLGAELVP